MRLLNILVLATSLLPLACSGSGSSSSSTSSAPTSAAEAHLRSSTAGGLDGRLVGIVNAIVLEDDQGAMTPNLVAGNPELVVSDPLGATMGFELQDFGPGKFVAVHISFVTNTLEYRISSGSTETITLQGGSIEAPFDRPLQATAMGAWWFELRHRAPVALIPGATPSEVIWLPDMVAHAGGTTLLRDNRFEVSSVDQVAGTVMGRLLDLDDMPATARFLSNAVLILGGTGYDEAGFLANLSVGDELQIYGVLDGRSELLIAFAERLDDPLAGPGNGRKNRVRGTIERVDQKTGEISVEVFEILIGGKSLPGSVPGMLELDASPAKIKWVPRYGRHGGHLPVSALESGMYVGVEWHNSSNGHNKPLAAHKVNIRSKGRLPYVHFLQGVVESVDLGNQVVVLRSETGGYTFGNQTYQTLTLRFAADALLVEDEAGSAKAIGLGDLEVGDDLEIQGVKQSGAGLEVTLLVVTR